MIKTLYVACSTGFRQVVFASSAARRPYRLAGEVNADFAEVERLVEQGDVSAAMDRYAGRLLPTSTVPAIADAAGASRRTCAPAHWPASAATLYAWACSGPGREDREAHRGLLDLLGPKAARRELIVGRLKDLPPHHLQPVCNPHLGTTFPIGAR